MKRENKKWFLERLKQYVRDRNNAKAFKEEDYDVNADGSVNLHVRADGGIYDEFATSVSLSPEVFSYIEEKTYYIPLSREIKIVFHGAEKQNREQIKRSFFKEYDKKFSDKCLDLKICWLKSVLLMAIGLFSLAIGVAVGNLTDIAVLSEILSVVASFTMWESVDFMLLERGNIKTERFNMAQLLLSQVLFAEE